MVCGCKLFCIVLQSPWFCYRRSGRSLVALDPDLNLRFDSSIWCTVHWTSQDTCWSCAVFRVPATHHCPNVRYLHDLFTVAMMLTNMITIWLFNIAMENGPFIDGLPIENGDFSMAMLNNQRVTQTRTRTCDHDDHVSLGHWGPHFWHPSVFHLLIFHAGKGPVPRNNRT